MQNDERTTLKIRCSKELFRKFKRIAADYDTYEKALVAIIKHHKRYSEPFKGPRYTLGR